MDLSYCITFQDAVERLALYSGGASLDKPTNKFRAASQDAYRDLTLNHAWRYLFTTLRIQLEAPFSTGTVTYVASTRILTLSGGTWPDWAGRGRLRIGDLVFQAEEKTGSTTLRLVDGRAPVNDIATPTAFQLYRSVYLLPANFRGVWQFHGENGRWGSDILANDDWLAIEKHSDWSGSPTRFTVMQTTEQFGYGRWAVFLTGYPNEGETFDAIYLRHPRPIKYAGIEAAAKGSSTATITTTGATVAGTGTAFSQDMVGSLMRFTLSSSENPTGRDGQSPFTEQIAIKAVTDATTLTLESAPAQAYTGKRFVITDPFEITPTMHSALYAGVEAHVDRITPDAKRRALSWGDYMREKQLAKESDSMVYLNSEAGLERVVFEPHRPLGPDQV